MMELPDHIKEDSMSTEEILLRLFMIVDLEMVDVKKRSDARLYPSEVVTIGLMFALKGGKYRPFYRILSIPNGRHLSGACSAGTCSVRYTVTTVCSLIPALPCWPNSI